MRIFYRAPDGSPDWTNTKAAVGHYAFIGWLLFNGIVAIFGAVFEWVKEKPFAPSTSMIDMDISIGWIILAWNGVTVAGGALKRITEPQVAEAANKRAETAAVQKLTDTADRVLASEVPKSDLPPEAAERGEDAV